jgi:hypothetical protein
MPSAVLKARHATMGKYFPGDVRNRMVSRYWFRCPFQVLCDRGAIVRQDDRALPSSLMIKSGPAVEAHRGCPAAFERGPVAAGDEIRARVSRRGRALSRLPPGFSVVC